MRIGIQHGLILLTLLLLAASCKGQGKAEGITTSENISQVHREEIVILPLKKDRKVTVHLVNVDLRSALQQVCRQAGMGYVLDMEGSAVRPITLDRENVSFTQCVGD